MKQSRLSRFSTRAIALAVLASVFALLAAGCGHHDTEKKEEGPREVETTSPHWLTLTREIDQPGRLISYETTPIYTKIAGFAEDVPVDIGDVVKKGQLLVKLWVPEVEEELRVKQARVKQAKADLKQSREAAKAAHANVESWRANVEREVAGIAKVSADVERWQVELNRGNKLLRSGVYNRQAVDELEHQLKSSKAALDEANARLAASKAALDESMAKAGKADADVEVADAAKQVAISAAAQWEAWLNYRELKAPYNGIVTLRNVHTGHFLQPSNSGSTSKSADPLFVVMRTDLIRVTVDVPEADSVLVKDGDKAIVRLQALSGREVIGTVTRSSWSFDERARTLRVEIHLKNKNGMLRAGMYANATIFAKRPNTLVLPANAILSDILANGDKNYCFVAENGKARKTFLKIGVRGDEGWEVMKKMPEGSTRWEDLTGKEQVIVTSPGSLLNDQPIVLKCAAKPAGDNVAQRSK